MDRPLATARPAHLGWRLLALLYDFFPALALWFATSLAVYLLRGKVPVRPDSLAAYAEFVVLWLLTGAYAVISWRRGGQTIGMRPWRLKVVTSNGRLASWRALCLRYVVATVSTLVFGLGLLWCLVDRERRGWHDLAAGTRFVRLESATKAQPASMPPNPES
jgi:uncharacterized RDD family membrane protein YckC